MCSQTPFFEVSDVKVKFLSENFFRLPGLVPPAAFAHSRHSFPREAAKADGPTHRARHLGVEIGWDVGDFGGVVDKRVVLEKRGGGRDRVGEDTGSLAEGQGVADDP